MQRPVPRLTRHAPSSRARVRLNGDDHYVGPWPAGASEPPKESQQAYDRLIGRWLAGGRKRLDTPGQERQKELSGVPSRATAGGPTVSQIILAYLDHADAYYRRGDGTPTGETLNYVHALRPLNHLFGHIPACQIGVRHLKQVRELMVVGYHHPQYGEQRTLVRKLINQRVGRIVRVFKWAANEDLIGPEVYLGMRVIEPLKVGRSAARESDPVKPVSMEHVEATLTRLRPQTAVAVRLQLLTGMRPGEVLSLTLENLDRTGPIWVYRPAQHKTQHHGKDRAVAIGPKAQRIILEFARIRCPLCKAEGRPPRMESPDDAICGSCAERMDRFGVSGPWQRVEVDCSRPLLSPRDEKEERHADLRARRKSRVQPSQVNRKKDASRQPGQRYTVTNYGNAIDRAARAAGVPTWNPNQLRHTHATEVRRQFGLEAAQAVLGHSKADVTQLYAERDFALAATVATKCG